MGPFLLAAALLLARHDEKASVSRIEIAGSELVWTVELSLQGLDKVLKFPADPLDLSERQLQALKGDLVAYLRRCLRVGVGGVDLEGEAGPLEPVYETFIATGEKYIAHARQQFRFRAPAPIAAATLSGAFFATLTDRHEAVLLVTWNGETRTFKRVGPFDLYVSPVYIRPTFWNTSAEFLRWGLHHIFVGYDHIAFLLALLLAARRLGEMVRVVTSFTVAHSLTLLLAALDVVRLPSAVTESLIAASIVYVAAENYFLKDGRHRWVLTFAFGLVHGLGFSSVLRERLQELPSILVPVLAFNLGVELGQIAILLVAFPLLAALRRAPDEAAADRRQRRLVRWGSAPIFLLGLAWLVDRVSGAGFMPF